MPLLKAAQGLRMVATFEEMRLRHPEPGVGRTMERSFRAWRVLHGEEPKLGTSKNSGV